MAATKNIPPAARPWAASTAKIAAQDMERNLRWFNVAMQPGPSNFFGPKGPADPAGLARDFRYQRMLTAVSALHPEALVDATRLTFDLMWFSERAENNKVIITEDKLRGLLLEAGLSGEAAANVIDSELASQANKQRLKDTTAEAVSRGAYGAPTICCGEKAFFGSDRFEQMAFELGLPWFGPDPARPTVGAASARL